MKSNDINMSTEQPQTTTKLIIDPTIPMEELLGSVTAYNSIDGSDARSQQLRTSARVFKKMKLDSAATSAIAEKSEKKDPIKEETKPEVRKIRPLWTPEEKDYFFEAINEFGKDFESIHSYISNKMKKKGLPESVIKSKDQIRHLYYRNCHKISKHLKFSDEIKKVTQELYGLINYGELRKKIGFVSEKTCVKLNELIYRGSVSIRSKGKTIKVRTPMSKALRKLNQLDEKQDELKLPTRITVELVPKDMNTFLKVQEIAQNPRIKCIVPLQKRLSNLISHMSERWRSKEAEEYLKTVDSMTPHTSDCFPEEKLSEDINQLVPPLRFAPLPNININLPTFNLSEYLTSQSMCLNAYEDRIGVKTPGEQLFQIVTTSSLKHSSKKNSKRPRVDSASDKTISPPSKQNLTVLLDECASGSEMKVDKVVDVAVNEILALQHTPKVEIDPEKLPDSEVKTEDDNQEEKAKEKIENVRKGWTANSCGNISVGDLYLMFGSDSKLVLEYSWDTIDKEKIKKESSLESKAETDIRERQEDVNGNEEENDVNASIYSPGQTELTLLLQKLLSMAKLHYRKNIVKCPCGHICGSKTSNKSKASKTLKVTFVGQDESTEKVNGGTPIEIKAAPAVVTPVPIIIQPQTNLAPNVIFRRPNSPTSALHAQLASISRLKPRYCNRRGRIRRNQHVVVERKLPVLANKADRDSGRQIVQMNIISQNNINTATPRPIAPKIIDITTDTTNGEVNQTLINTEYVNGSLQNVHGLTQNSNYNGQGPVYTKVQTSTYSVVPVNQTTVVEMNQVSLLNVVPITETLTDNATTPSRVGSPTSISNLLDIALAPVGNGLNSEVENAKDKGNISFAGLLSENVVTSTPPSSPSRILKEDNQWLNSEVGDFSLSSFLGHLDSPMKADTPSVSAPAEDTRMGLTREVEQHFQSLLTESSLDYTEKFADLAAQVIDLKK